MIIDSSFLNAESWTEVLWNGVIILSAVIFGFILGYKFKKRLDEIKMRDDIKAVSK